MNFPRLENDENEAPKAASDNNKNDATAQKQSESSSTSSTSDSPRVLITGLKRLQTRQLGELVEGLGGQVVTTSNQCTHLVADRVSRTAKFLTTVSVARHVVTPQWIEESSKEGKFLDERNFPLRDTATEQKFDFVWSEARERARNQKLFQVK